jgi:hypothetical protein
MYINTISINTALLETVLWEGQSRINYQSSIDFYNSRVGIYRNRIIPYYEELLSDTKGQNYDFAAQLLYMQVCQIFRNADQKGGDYPGCEVSLAGQAKKEMVLFLKQYLNLLDKFFTEWQILNNAQDRLDLLKKDEYASIIAYASRDQYGTADALFYHILLPSFTRLLATLEEISSQSTLSNIVCAVLIILMSVLVYRSATIQYTQICQDYLCPIRCIPYRLIPSNPILQRYILSLSRHS